MSHPHKLVQVCLWAGPYSNYLVGSGLSVSAQSERHDCGHSTKTEDRPSNENAKVETKVAFRAEYDRTRALYLIDIRQPASGLNCVRPRRLTAWKNGNA